MSEQTQENLADTVKKPWYKRWWGIGAIALGALVLLTAIFGAGGETTPQAEPSAEATPTAEPSETAAAASAEATPSEPPATQAAEQAATNEAGIGMPVRDGKFEFTVEGVQPGVASVGDEFLNQNAQGAFTLVTLKVTNIGDAPQTFYDSNVRGFDSQGRELSPDSTAGLYANPSGEGWINEINPGNSVTALVVFDLPAGETLTKIRVQDSAFSGGATINLS